MVQYGEPVRPVKEVEAVGMEVSPKGETIIDFGQNLAGVLRVKVDLPAGTKLILDHFETKDSQGNYFNNIAGADMTGHTQTDVYISNGKPAEYRPHFTYHGFRYVRVICDAPVKPEDFTAVAHAGQFWARDKAEKDDKMAFFMQHPVFGGYKHMFFNVEDNVLKAIAPAKYADFLKAQGRSDQMENALEAFNYLTRLVESGEAQLISDINSKEMIEQNPYQSHLTGMFYKGKQGKPLAVVVPGGGFISNVTDCEGYPVAMKLHKLGYSVLVISYPIGKQLGETEHEKQGQAAVRELVQVIRYLKEHEQELSVDMDDYAIFGFSAGGMMTTAYSFANYEDCCHKVKLPRPKVIFPMYGLDWNVKALEQDKGLAVFSIAGREDEYGFGNVEKRLPQLKSVLGEDNVSVRIYDNLGHGFGIGSNTIVPHWFEEAVEFWEAHRK